MKRQLHALACAGAVVTGAAVLALVWPVQSAHAEDFATVLAWAQRHDPQGHIAEAQAAAQQAVADGAQAALRPQWAVTGGASRGSFGNPLTWGNTNTLGSQISQTLWAPATRHAATAAQLGADAEQRRWRAVQLLQVGRVAAAYFGVLAAQAQLRSVQGQAAAFAEQARWATERYRLQLAAQVDMDQARVFAELSQGSLTQSQQAVAEAEAALRALVGQPVGALTPLAPRVAVTLGDDADDWVSEAWARHPLLDAEQRRLAAADARVASAQAGHAPTVSAVLGSAFNRTSGVAGTGPQHQLSVQFTLPVYSGGAQSAAERQAVQQHSAQRAQVEQTRRDIEREVRTQHAAVRSSAAWVERSAQALAAAERTLQATRAGLQLGTRTQTDTLLALQALAQAQISHDQARHRLALSQVLLRVAAARWDEGALALVASWMAPAASGV